MPPPSPTHRMTAAKAVVESFRRFGLDTVFGLPGVDNLPLYDALHGAPDIRHVLARNESGAAIMADGYARASGRPAALFTITGPGVLNAMTGVAEAHAASSPILWVATEIPAHTRSEGKKGVLHELEDQMALVQTVTRFQCRVEDPGAVPSALAMAWRHLTHGRRGPVYVEIPLNVLDREGEVSFPEPSPPAEGAEGGRGRGREVDEAAIRKAADLLRAAERPVLVIGGGAAWAGAGGEAVRVAERLGSPVLSTPTGKGVFPEDHPLFLGSLWSNTWDRREPVRRVLEESDVCLAAGTRFSAVATDEWKVRLPERLIRLDADAGRLNENYPSAVGIAGDAKHSLAALMEALGETGGGPGGPGGTGGTRGETWFRRGDDSGPDPAAGALLREIRGGLPRDAITTWDSLISLWAATRFPAFEPRTFLLSSGLCTLGYALPAAIGAQMAHPDRRVVAVTGDGAFLFTLAELATLAEEGLPVTVLLLDDGGYRAVRNAQERHYGGRTIACDLRNPDFVRLAESFGIEARRLPGVEAVGKALAEPPTGPQLFVLELALTSP